jgi:Protein of unknown function (DUF1566)
MARSRRRRLQRVVLPFVAASATLACNGIIGLSDYERAECNGGEICGDSGPDAPLDARDGEVVAVDASGTKKVSWPHFVMPNYAQDGGPGENVPTYSPTVGGFLDSVSSLVWNEPIEKKGDKSYEEAEKICANLTVGGKWRLPSRIELVTLLDLGRPGKKIDEATFGSTEPLEYWTSSEVRPDPASGRMFWTVNFSVGGLGKQDVRVGSAGVRCIKDQ